MVRRIREVLTLIAVESLGGAAHELLQLAFNVTAIQRREPARPPNISVASLEDRPSGHPQDLRPGRGRRRVEPKSRTTAARCFLRTGFGKSMITSKRRHTAGSSRSG